MPKKEASKIDRGRYLIEVGGCNDCHTDGYIPTAGKVPEADWLTGSAVGFNGPWGTTYPINLRLLMNTLTEKEWISFAKTTEGMPPMPWWALHTMTNEDLSSIYAFVKHLGPKGEPAPGALPPGEAPAGPYIDFSVHLPTKN
ncbi:MAG: cytochrome C [Candidatus Kapabacteria bacterium]|nr:cytochrome C [Candidatus Kapabacteria bacterium]